ALLGARHRFGFERSREAHRARGRNRLLRHTRRGRISSGSRLMNIDLTSKSAVVTGATRGIGRAIAASLASAGARVAIVGRNAETANAVATEIGGGAQGFAADIGDATAAAAMIGAVEGAFGAVDILVNNAGITRDNIMPRLKDADWDEVINANLRGAFVTTRAAVRGMMKRRWGRVIN